MRLKKFITGTGFCCLALLLVLVVPGWSGLNAELVLAGISLAALVLTAFRWRDYINSLEDRMNLRLIFIPMLLNLSLSGTALVCTHEVPVFLLALLGVVGWLCVFLRVRAKFADYIPYHRGSLPADIWLNPPVEQLHPGDVILVHGPMADRVKNAVGHAEIVVLGGNGRLHVISSMIESGLAWHTARALLKSYVSGGFDWIVLRLRQPLTDEQNRLSAAVVEEMKAGNKAWTAKAARRARSIIAGLPLPSSVKEKLRARWKPTGYDTIGKYWGGLRQDRWTCIGACLYMLRRLGVRTDQYGTGAFGLCGELNPLMPIRLMRDRAYRWLTVEDRDRCYRQRQARLPAVSA